ncbi:MAG: response regulator [Alphaproteobacteria bacterium]|nr:response regulator [Alphaproteobacteria bacterium]
MRVEPGRVLIVDDNRMNRMKLSHSLVQQGHATVEAVNGREALELLRAETFDLVLLDILMPEVDGFQVLREMKDDRVLRDLPVIVISAMDEMDSVVRCIEMGAEDHLPKDFDPVLLNARIGACLEKKRLRDEVTEQLKFIREIFGKYVPESVAKQIVASKGMLEPKLLKATILFTDIENFTTTAESIPPKQVVQMLSEYFPAVIEPITRHGGVVNQFQGDAMLVTFNVPIEDPQHAEKAVKAALEIQEVLKGQTFAGVELRTRIGINTGDVIAGNVGAGDRINYTVYGDAVNVASRIEQLNKELGTLVLISESTVDLLRDKNVVESMGDVSIRGKNKTMRVFKPRI